MKAPLQIDTMFYIFKNVKYVAFLSLGIYFINMANILEKYQRERTNFAEFEETVTELPTIVTYPVPQNSGMKNGVDFNISFQVASDFDSVSQTHLTQSGVYPVFGSSLEIVFEPLYDGNFFKIVPTNFKTRIVQDFELIFTFDSTSIQESNTLILTFKGQQLKGSTVKLCVKTRVSTSL